MAYSVKTKPWVITISVGVIVILFYLISWLLVGEIDLLGKHWIVGHNGILWDGKLTTNNIDWLWNKYQTALTYGGDTYNDLVKWAAEGKSLTIISPNVVFNPYLLLIIFGGLILAIVYPLIFKLLKWGNYDILAFSITTAIVCITFFITALIPHWGAKNNVKSNQVWYDLVRLLISALVGFGTFFFVNWTVNKFYITNDNALPLINELKASKQSADAYNKELKDLVDSYKESNDKEYIDLEDIKKK